MDIDEILNKMSDIVEKDKKYLKGLYTKGLKELTEQFGNTLDKERISTLTLTKIGKQYNMTKDEVDKLVYGDIDSVIVDDDDDLSFLEDDNEDEGVKIYDDVDDVPKPTVNSWDDYMEKVPDPLAKARENSKYERTPSLIVELGPTYYLRTDISETPFDHEFEGKYGPYINTAIKVWMDKVSDTDLYDVKYTKGDFAGKPAFVNGQKYTLWMDEKCMGFFKLFWMKHRGVPVPDDRVFTFKHTKKGNYNVWQFGIPK